MVSLDSVCFAVRKGGSNADVLNQFMPLETL